NTPSQYSSLGSNLAEPINDGMMNIPMHNNANKDLLFMDNLFKSQLPPFSSYIELTSSWQL
ncbi:MAG: hypothetical protein KAX31_07565, partial [Thermoplasmata archaeon]|nr:hypothetical protein [Thermoplasmata archaeon]